MTFNESNIDIVLKTIEENLRFCGEELSEPQNWNFKLNLPVQDIIDKSPRESEKIRYAIKTLETIGYIKFANGDYSVINGITPSGLKYMFLRLHNIKFI